MLSKLDYECISNYKNSKMYKIKKAKFCLRQSGISEFNNRINKKRTQSKNSILKDIVFDRKTVYIICSTQSEYNQVEGNKDIKDLFDKYGYKVKPYLLIKYYKGTVADYKISSFDFEYYFRYKAFIFYSKNKKIDLKNMRGSIYINDISDINKLDFNSLIKLFSNYVNNNCVSVRCSTFYDFKGYNYFSGGAERYLCDLNELFSEKNVNMDIYQEAEVPFIRKYRNINVMGLSGNGPIDYSEDYYFDRTNKYNYQTKNTSQLHIYSAFFECYPFALSPSVGISHGIGWDNESNVWRGGVDFEFYKQNFIESAIMCDNLVSVDTNTCNWFQTIDYNLGAKKFSVIPNYVDIDEFSPRDNYLDVGDKIIITYPRRLYGARGLYTLLNITDKLLKKYKNIEIHYVGKGNDTDIKAINKVIDRNKGRVFCYSRTPEEMHNVYKNTDISVIPTMFSEGTSLSCLEAMASGNLVISTRIGGLSDLVIDNYNGYLIEPNEDALYDALCDAIENYSDRISMKKNAREVAAAFNKKIWKEKWRKVLNKYKYKKSENIELVEFVVNNFKKINDDFKEKIINSLLDNKLVYIREKKNSNLNNSCQRLQFIDYYSVDESCEHPVYFESKELKTDLKKIVNFKH